MSGWIVDEDEDREFTGAYDVSISSPIEGRDYSESIGACYREHARLIASAPDLLEALKFATSWIEALPAKNSSHMMRDDRVASLRQAISKATGDDQAAS
jgi:hypothetical protein